ncbi:MAG: hypothetical protein IT436_04075 [Phycisphaerales bacterium]|nr:hypothetical protein [Phycisphaerales bacterium]
MRAAKVLAALVVGTCAVPAARAEVVHFINPAPGQPGHYGWGYELGVDRWLDITTPPPLQTNTPNGRSVSQASRSLWGEDPLNVHVGDELASSARVLALVGGWSYPTYCLEFGEAVQARLFEFDWIRTAEHVAPASVWPLMSHFPEGESGYMGVRTTEGHLGWIEVVRGGMSLTARAWAYETEAGAPIVAGQIPAPGAAVVIGLGVFTASRRRS